MLDSSNKPEQPHNDFDCHQHLENICKKTKITVAPYADIAYPIGWQGLMEKFIDSMASISCTIERVTQEYGYFDMQLMTRTLANEARILSKMSNYRRQFQETCHRCGGSTFCRPEAGWRQTCKTCMKTAGQKGLTGTWLDKF